MGDNQILKTIQQMRESDKEFNELVERIDNAIENIIKVRNSSKSFSPTDAQDYCLKVKVEAVPMTKEQKKCLEDYLEDRYLYQVKGDRISIKKCCFSKQYLIKSYFEFEFNDD